MHLSGLYIYPVKSLRGCALATAMCDRLGLRDDRRFLVVDETGEFLSQRTVPAMAQVQPVITGDRLVLQREGCAPVSVARVADASSPPPLVTVRVWQSEGLRAEDCGPEAAAWLGEALGRSCRLVRIGPAFRRPIPERKLPPAFRRPENRDLLRPEGVSEAFFVTFADAYPQLVVGEGSLEDLNARLAARGEPPVPMNRFRPNLVVAGGAPFAEDRWRRIKIGTATFRAGGPCARCIVTTTDQRTGERGVEPLRTLAGYRRDLKEPSQVNFGQNLVSESAAGSLSLGDPVEVLEGEA